MIIFLQMSTFTQQAMTVSFKFTLLLFSQRLTQTYTKLDTNPHVPDCEADGRTPTWHPNTKALLLVKDRSLLMCSTGLITAADHHSNCFVRRCRLSRSPWLSGLQGTSGCSGGGFVNNSDERHRLRASCHWLRLSCWQSLPLRQQARFQLPAPEPFHVIGGQWHSHRIWELAMHKKMQKTGGCCNYHCPYISCFCLFKLHVRPHDSW